MNKNWVGLTVASAVIYGWIWLWIGILADPKYVHSTLLVKALAQSAFVLVVLTIVTGGIAVATDIIKGRN